MMSFHIDRLREGLKFILRKVGLLATAQQFLRWIKVLSNPKIRRLERARRERFLRFKRQYGDVLRHSLNREGHEQRRVLVVGSGQPLVETELGLIKALELAGFIPVVLIKSGPSLLRKFYNLTSVKEVHLLDEFSDPLNFPAAEAVLERFRSLQELLTFEYAGARVGRHACALVLRRLRLGSLDLQLAEHRRILVKYVARGMASATAAQRILRKIRPELALFVDTVYTPRGELFDNCLANGIDVIKWYPAHKSNSLMLKRYTLDNRDQHPISLSAESWRLVRSMEWTDARRAQLERELYSSYASGDWYGESGTQFNKRFVDADEIRKQLGLDPSKRTAFILPHILWDASFVWGTNLFRTYEEWFIETVRAACVNDKVNWVIKIHPAHVVKSIVGGFHGEPAEVVAVREQIGELPPHVSTIPAESDISTFSLFELMDYCLTVHGTGGIEAARLGIPVLTAGTGRYSHKGFTIDSESREQYLERVARIQEISPLSLGQRELAERFAYGIFMLRPLPLTTMTLEYHKNYRVEEHFNRIRININIRTKQEWYDALDLRAFAQWATESSQPDFLMPLPESQDARNKNPGHKGDKTQEA